MVIKDMDETEVLYGVDVDTADSECRSLLSAIVEVCRRYDRDGTTLCASARGTGHVARAAAAAGVGRVADEADDVPQYVLDLPEEIVLVTHVPMVDNEVWGEFGLPTIAALSNDTLMANNLVPGPVDFFLVNGDLNPIIELDEGAFTRMRFIFSSIAVGVNIRWVAH